MMRRDEYDILFHSLKQMRLSGMAEELERQFSDPNTDLMCGDERIIRLIRAEMELRHTKKLNRLVKKSNIRYPQASIDSTIEEPSRKLDAATIYKLAECSWIREKRNLIITGLTGAGKSWCACALVMSAMQKMYTVYYDSTEHLLQKLHACINTRELMEKMEELRNFDVLILDDSGLMNFDFDMCRNLFQLIDLREGRASTIIVSQYPVSEWFELFSSHTYADATLDRIMSTAYRLDFQGESLRRK